MRWTVIDVRRTKKQITQAINRYARRHNHYADAVRNSTMTYRAAILEDDVRIGAVSLETARALFAERYPDTKKDGAMNVAHWIK
jgi:hypothetical protein